MSFLGMGTMEILLIVVLAFIFLGPERMVDAARMLGKLVREGRKLASELPQVVIEDDDIKVIYNDEAPGPTQGATRPTPQSHTPKEGADPNQEVPEGPVSHQPARTSPPIPSKPPEEPPKT